MKIGTRNLTNILYTIEVQRIIHQYIQDSVLILICQNAVLLSQRSRDHFHRINIHDNIRDINNLILKSLSESFKHLPLGDIVKCYKRTTKTHSFMLLLICYSLTYLFVRNISEFLQNITYSYVSVILNIHTFVP